MINHIALGIMVDDSPIFFGPDATSEGQILLEREAAGNHHTGAGQSGESVWDVSGQIVERCKKKKRAMMGRL